VTGASSGIGRELATQFADNDFDLVVTAEDADIVTAARELEPSGVSVEAVQVDLSTGDGVEELYLPPGHRDGAAA
jgi:short-subunit dehydrogenase